MGWPDRLVILTYLALTAALGLGFGASWGRRRAKRGGGGDSGGREGYLLAGRRLSLPAFVAALVSTWYGGILGVGEYSYQHGLSNWLVFGVPYYLAAALFAVFIAGRAQQARVLSLPEQLQRAYGRGPGAIAAAVVLVMTLPAAYLLTSGLLLHLAFGLPLAIGVVLATAFSVLCNWVGGFRSVVRTNLLQFALMFAGFALLLAFLLPRFGPGYLTAHLPAGHFTWNGGKPPQAIFVWYLIALTTLVEPAFYLHCFAAATPQVARRGLFLSIAAWCCFDAMTTTAGLYARALLADLPAAQATEAFPRLAAAILPSGLLGLFYVGLFATVLSTVDSYLFLSATALGPDLFARLRGRARAGVEPAPAQSAASDGEARRLTAWTRLGLLLAGGAAAAIALVAGSVVKIWHDFGTIGTCTLLVPAVSSFFPRLRMSRGGALAAMALALPTVLAWTFSRRWTGDGDYWLGLEPIYPSLVLGLLVWLLDRLQLRLRIGRDVAPEESPAPR